MADTKSPSLPAPSALRRRLAVAPPGGMAPRWRHGSLCSACCSRTDRERYATREALHRCSKMSSLGLTRRAHDLSKLGRARPGIDDILKRVQVLQIFPIAEGDREVARRQAARPRGERVRILGVGAGYERRRTL